MQSTARRQQTATMMQRMPTIPSMGSGPPLWPVEPAQRVGAFHLGMGVNEALVVVQKMGSLDRAEFCFDEQHPLDADLCLRMPSLGLQFCFDGFQQDLRVITVCLQQHGTPPGGSSVAYERDATFREGNAWDPVAHDTLPFMLPPLSYSGRIFAGVHQPALCLRDVYTMFGPTWIGDFQSGDQAAYFLRYPGIAFEFPLPKDMVDILAARGEHPTELPGRPPPTAVRMWVFAADSPSFLAPVSAMPELPEAVVVRPATGVELHGRMLRFGAMPQDIFSDFGPPEQVCVKDVDAVRIHSSRAWPSRPSGPDYYYNYFHLGLDILFDGHTHLVKKIILHTNPPTHEIFSRYSRCFFQLPIEVPCSVSPWGEADALEEEMLPFCIQPWQEHVKKDVGCERNLTEEVAVHMEQPNTVDMATQVVEITDTSGNGAPRDCESALDVAVVGEGEGEVEGDGDREVEGSLEQTHSTGKRISKRDRKAARKNRRSADRAPIGTPPFSTDASPQLSVLSSSPDPSPIFTRLQAGCVNVEGDSGNSFGGAADGHTGVSGEPPCFEELPPPALPLDSLDARSNVDSETVAPRQASVRSPSARAMACGYSSRPTTGGIGGSQPEALRSAIGSMSGASPIGHCDRRELRSRTDELSSGLRGLCGKSAESLCIDVRWSWPEIQEVLGSRAGCGCGKPLIMSQSGHTPFGSTYFYAFPGLAFEVMQNGGVASLTIFSVPHEELPSVFLPRGRSESAT